MWVADLPPQLMHFVPKLHFVKVINEQQLAMSENGCLNVWNFCVMRTGRFWMLKRGKVPRVHLSLFYLRVGRCRLSDIESHWRKVG